MDAYRRFPLGPEPGHDDAAGMRNAASSDPASGPGSDGTPAGEPEAPVGPTADGEQESEAVAIDEHQVRRDLDELTAKAEKADEYLELAKRTKADFENYRKRTARDAAAAQTRGVIKLVRDLLPAVDNLDRAVGAALNGGTETDEVASGVKLVHDELIAALGRAGVELFSPEGERFDPESHEAVAQRAVEGAEPGTIIEVYQRGCRLGDAVIRPARVVVAG
jgi:molecular chaperone GrpE